MGSWVLTVTLHRRKTNEQKRKENMIHFRIKVGFRTEGDCIFRKDESLFPPLPDWSEYTWGGRVPEGQYIKGQAIFPYKKRWLGHDLYYKAYHVEYMTNVRVVDIDKWRTPPSQDYLEYVTHIIHPLPNEFLVLRQIAWGSEKPHIYHELHCYYKFIETDGVILAVLEKSEEEHYIENWNRRRTKSKRIPVNFT